MGSIVRRVRAALVIGSFWAATWMMVGLMFGLYAWFRRPGGAATFVPWMLGSALPFAVLGAVCGVGFAALLSRAERDHTVDELVNWRIASFGAVASTACFVAYLGVRGSLLLMWSSEIGPLVASIGIFAALGGLSSFGSLAIAKRGSLPMRERHHEIAAS